MWIWLLFIFLSALRIYNSGQPQNETEEYIDGHKLLFVRNSIEKISTKIAWIVKLVPAF